MMLPIKMDILLGKLPISMDTFLIIIKSVRIMLLLIHLFILKENAYRSCRHTQPNSTALKHSYIGIVKMLFLHPIDLPL